MTIKLCTKCNEEKELSDFYKNKGTKDGLTVWCKKCMYEKATKRYYANKEIILEKKKIKYENNREYYLQEQKIINSRSKERLAENLKRWQKNNPDKTKGYNKYRDMHKKHDISDKELNILYEYCDSSCMYCGIPEIKAKEIYKQRLHKDHALNLGSNGIDNCVMACKSCNGSKHTKDWNEWYTPFNQNYTKERFDKITYWLENCKEIIESKVTT